MKIVAALLLVLPLAAHAGGLAPPLSGAIACQGNDSAFSREAETLIAAQIGNQRIKLAPRASPLTPNPVLTRIAQQRACDMAQGIVPFSHRDADGNFIALKLVRARFGLEGLMGENIAERGASRDSSGVVPFDPEEFSRITVNEWMASAEHRANILSPYFGYSGIGVAMVNGTAVATELFYSPAP